MNGAASVHSIPMLREFKAALATFVTEAKESQSVNDMTVHRGIEDFQVDLLKFWQTQIRKREDAVTNAKAEFERCRMQSFGDRVPDCTDQKVALKKAQMRLEVAQDKLKAVKKWSRVLDEEVEEYRGQSQLLVDMLSGDMPKALAELDRLLTALEAYIGVTAPMAGSEVSMVNSAPETTSTAPTQTAAESAPAEPVKS
jgi:hypothetical protein